LLSERVISQQKDAQIDQLKQQYQHILEQFRLAQQKQFGKSSEVSNADKVCDGCANARHKMGEDKSEQLAFIPAQVKVIEHVRLKYSCRHCVQQGTEVTIKIAPVPVSAIPKRIATASLLSHIITNKYQYALPLYRQESLFKQYSIALSRQTMARWLLKLTPLLNRVYQHCQQHLLQRKRSF